VAAKHEWNAAYDAQAEGDEDDKTPLRRANKTRPRTSNGYYAGKGRNSFRKGVSNGARIWLNQRAQIRNPAVGEDDVVDEARGTRCRAG
jgi:hypothetical protein